MSLARWTRILPWLAVVAVLLLACFQVENRDLWWHLAAGRWAVEQGQPPTTDIFAQGDPGPWVNESWLAQVLFWGVERVGGAAGLVLSKLLLLGGLFTLLVRFLQPRVGPVVAAWLVLVTGVGMWERLMVRPELFTFLASLAVYLLCRRYEATGTRWVWGLLGIQLLWANLHNGFLFGILLVGCLWVGMLLDARVHRRWAEPAVRARAREWGLVLLALPVVSCLTPNGPALLIEPVRHLGETYLFRVAEWKSLSAVFPGYATVVFGVTLLLAGGSLLLNRRAVRIGDSLLLLALFCMAWRYHRFVALLVLLAVPIIAENLAGWRRAEPGPTRSPAVPAAVGTVLVLAGLMGATVTDALYQTPWYRSTRRFGLGLSTYRYPLDTLAFLKEADLPGHVMNEYNAGGMFLWECFPDRGAFMDGRHQVKGAAYCRDYETLITGGPGWERLVEAYDLNVFLISYARPVILALHRSADWRPVFFGRDTVLFLRVAPANQRWLSAYTPTEFDVLAADRRPPRDFYRLNAAGALARAQFFVAIEWWRAAAADLLVLRELFPEEAGIHLNLAGCLRQQGECYEAIHAYLEAARLGAPPLPVQLGLGECYERVGEVIRAREAYQTALRLDQTGRFRDQLQARLARLAPPVSE